MSGYEQATDVLPGVRGPTSSTAAVLHETKSSSKNERHLSGLVAGACGNCAAALGCHPPVPNMEAGRWYCLACNSILFAKADAELQKKYTGIAPLGPDAYVKAVEATWPLGTPEGDEAPSAQLIQLVKELCNQDFGGVERRRYRRYPFVAAVCATPLDEHFRIVGVPMRMATTNISHDGVSLIHQGEYEAAYLAIDFSEGGFALKQAIVRRVRMRSLGVVHETGGRFVRGLARRTD